MKHIQPNLHDILYISHSKRTTKDKPQIMRSEDIYNNLHDIKNLYQEHFVVFFLNTDKSIICREVVSKGTLNQTIIHPRDTFRQAIIHNANSIILAHNHVSGSCEASDADILATKNLIKAGNILSISVLDHIIVTKNSFVSMRETHYEIFVKLVNSEFVCNNSNPDNLSMNFKIADMNLQWIRKKPEYEQNDYYFSGKCMVTKNVLDKIGKEQVDLILKDLFSYIEESKKNNYGIDYLQVYENKNCSDKIFVIDQLSQAQLDGDEYTEEQKREYNYFTVLFNWEY